MKGFFLSFFSCAIKSNVKNSVFTSILMLNICCAYLFLQMETNKKECQEGKNSIIHKNCSWKSLELVAKLLCLFSFLSQSQGYQTVW